MYSVTGVDFATLAYADIPKIRNAAWDAASETWTNDGYRLPTEMEWMWAAMGATSDRSNGYSGTGTNTKGYTKGYAGSTELAGAQAHITDYAWCNYANNWHSYPAGTKLPNELGLYDMSGNVWEYNWDWYGTYPTGAQTDYRGPAPGTKRIFRGGSWYGDTSNCILAARISGDPNSQSINVGFRVVRP